MNQNQIQKLIKELEEKWSIKVGERFDPSYNYVAPVTQTDGTEAVLKIGLFNDKGFKTEAEVLRAFEGKGIIKLLKEDLENNAILIERVRPGIPVSSLEDDEKATRIIASVMKRLWKKLPENHNFPTLFEWFRGFEWYKTNFKNGPIPEDLFNQAENLFKIFLENPHAQYLLHGDLHHENVLSSNRDTYLAIDPKGVVGEREYEVAAVLRNPYQKLIEANNLPDLLRRRIEVLSEELGFDKQRIRDWGIAQTVLSVIWSLEKKNDRVLPWLKIAQALSQIK